MTLRQFRELTKEWPDNTPIIVRQVGGEYDEDEVPLAKESVHLENLVLVVEV